MNENEQGGVQLDPQQIAAGLAVYGLPALTNAYRGYYGGMRNATADNPAPRPARDSYEPLQAAFQERVREFDPSYDQDKQLLRVTPSEAVGRFPNRFSKHSALASNLRLSPDDPIRSTTINGATPFKDVDNIIAINPFHDEAAFAHELGHTVTQRTKLGNMLHQAKGLMRDPSEPLHPANLANTAKQMEGKGLADKARLVLRHPGGARQVAALATALLPGIAASLTPGSDDLAASLAIAYAINSPTLLDEAFASGEGLGIMKRAGRPATAGQRARLAGNFASYLVKPTVTALAANVAGNFFDENV